MKVGEKKMISKLKFNTKLSLSFIIMIIFIFLNLFFSIVIQRNSAFTRNEEIEIMHLMHNIYEIRVVEKEFIKENKREYASEINKIIIKTFAQAKSLREITNNISIKEVEKLLSEYEKGFYQYTAVRDRKRALESRKRIVTKKLINNMTKNKNVYIIENELKDKTILLIMQIEESTNENNDSEKKERKNEIEKIISELEKNYEKITNVELKIKTMETLFALREYKDLVEKIWVLGKTEEKEIKQLKNISENLNKNFMEMLGKLNEKEKNRNRIYNSVTWFFFLSFIFLTLATLIYVNRSTKNILTQFINITKAVANGNYEQRVNVTVRDQIGELGDNFNLMAGNLREYEEKLLGYNKVLEKKVEERTEELQQAIKSLEKYQEEIIVAKDKAESSSRAKSEFVSNMSHELRTPLNAILGFSEILFAEEDNEKKKKFLGMIKDAGENLLNIINDILDISKIEAGMMRIKSEPFSIKEVAESIEHLFMEMAKEKGNKLMIIDMCKSRYVIGDILRIKQILTNLVGNALKFTENGLVTVEMTEKEIDKNNIVVNFKVNDTGIGISSDKMNNLFEMFNQGEYHLTKKYGGTGIGLAIVKKLTDIMNGRVSAESNPGEGTEFNISIPFSVFEG